MKLNCIIKIIRRAIMKVKYTKLESIHSALQELQNRYAIPNDDVDLDNALQFTEDLREPYLKENKNDD